MRADLEAKVLPKITELERVKSAKKGLLHGMRAGPGLTKPGRSQMTLSLTLCATVHEQPK